MTGETIQVLVAVDKTARERCSKRYSESLLIPPSTYLLSHHLVGVMPLAGIAASLMTYQFGLWLRGKSTDAHTVLDLPTGKLIVGSS